jgi:MinD-like ATPase involved in chromosome partitioning or flagellar assembly
VILGRLFSELRGEITVLDDANSSLESIRQRVVPLNQAYRDTFIRFCELAGGDELAPEWSSLAPFVDMVERLRVLTNASADPVLVEQLHPDAFDAGIALLRRAAQIVISNMGTSVASPVTQRALDSATSLVICTRMSQETLELTIEAVSAYMGEPMTTTDRPREWSKSITDGRYANLVENAVLVIAPAENTRDPSNLARYVDWFRSVIKGGVVLVPTDQHLAKGSVIYLEGLSLETRLAYLEVAALLAAQFRNGPGLS